MEGIGAVVIGRNEGERFIRCLDSLLGVVQPIIYVDSGSTDGSIEHAEKKGVEVVKLNTSIPFTAARARNAGFARLRSVAPSATHVMFVDGDCEVDPGWLPHATDFFAKHDGYAVVCGRRRERFPEASVYNYLCDLEWNTPVGDTQACGGDALMRTDAFEQVDGFDSSLIAGEEPELCVRLRQAGWKIRRIDQEMTHHDANVTQFSQWWTRAVRAGHAYAQGAAIHGKAPERHWVRESQRAFFWGFALPASALLLSIPTRGWSLSLLLLYPLNIVRIAWRLRSEGERRPWTVAFFLTLSKFPEALGHFRYARHRRKGEQTPLIEYK